MTTKKMLQQVSGTRQRDDFPKKEIIEVFDLSKRELKKLEKVPLILLKESKEFIERNSLVKVNGKPSHKYCCQKCLKGHILKRAVDLGIDAGFSSIMLSIFDGDVGHEGYYMDKDNLIKI